MNESKKIDKSRQYKQSTRDRLHLLSGNQCYAPECEKSLMAKDGVSPIRKICHIEAASDNGPRCNTALDDDERRHFDNLILLCDECHTIIDNMNNVEHYSVSLLKDWKKNHEAKHLHSTLNNPSMLNDAILAIADLDIDDVDPNDKGLSSFDIDAKLDFNKVVRSRSWIDEYKVCYHIINSLYDELEAQGSFKKVKLLRNVRNIYVKIKGSYVGDSESQQDIVSANADNIIEDVEEELLKLAKSQRSVCEEDLSFGISLILVDAFMRCKILEKPVEL